MMCKRFKPRPALVPARSWQLARWAGGGLVCLCLLLTGCGGQPTTFVVKGKVVYTDGTPVRFGDIETLAVEQRVNARGKIQSDGTFTLTTYQANDGALPGKHQAVIIQTTSIPLAAAAKMPAVKHAHGNDMAPKYRSYSTSGLSFTVEPSGPNEVTLVIEEFTAGEYEEQTEENADPQADAASSNRS